MFRFPFKNESSILNKLVSEIEIEYLSPLARLLEENKVQPFFGYHYDNKNSAKELEDHLDIIGLAREREGHDNVVKRLLEGKINKRLNLERKSYCIEYLDNKKGPYSDSKITARFNLTPIADIIELLRKRPRQINLTMYD